MNVKRLWAAGSSIGVVLVCAACGGTTVTDGAAGGVGVREEAGVAGAAGAAGSAHPGTPGGAGGTTASEAGAAGSGASDPKLSASVHAWQVPDDQWSLGIVAAFVSEPSDYDPCTTTHQEGACEYRECEWYDNPEPSTSPHAGRIEVTGMKVPFSFEPDANGFYTHDYSENWDGERALWEGGELIRIVAEGGDFPAFTIEAVAPEPVVVIEPDLPAGTLLVPPDEPLAFGWLPTTGDVGVAIETEGDGTMPSQGVYCVAPGEDEELVVPPSMLAQLPASPLRLTVQSDTWTGKDTEAGAIRVLTVEMGVDTQGRSVQARHIRVE